MKVLEQIYARPTQDGDGVKIKRVAEFQSLKLDPFLMVDELKSDDAKDYIGGFPAHPHRGIETFTYILKGGFEHRDQMGNKKAIRAGDVQWMSTGSGVIHSEMPLADAEQGMHGFQIWLNMPANEKMRPAKYQDTTINGVIELSVSGFTLRVLSGSWSLADQTETADINDLASDGAVADLIGQANAEVDLSAFNTEMAAAYIYQGEVNGYSAGQLLLLDGSADLNLKAGTEGVGLLLFKGKPIDEEIVHYGPFVMNTQQQIHQAISDYQSGKFGTIV